MYEQTHLQRHRLGCLNNQPALIKIAKPEEKTSRNQTCSSVVCSFDDVLRIIQKQTKSSFIRKVTSFIPISTFLTNFEKQSYHQEINRESLRNVECSISEAQWQHDKKVYQKFNCQNIGDHHDSYLRTDSLYLRALVRGFVNSASKHYVLTALNFPMLSSLRRCVT